MSRKAQSTQSQVIEESTITANTIQEEVMNEQQEITLAADEAAIVSTSGNTLILKKEDLIAVKSMAKTMNKEYSRKAKEQFYADKRPKPEGSIQYDQDMFNRTQVILAFVNAILDSIEIPTRKDRTQELVAAFGGKVEEA